MTASTRTRWFVAAVLLVGFLLRLGVILATRDYVPVNDAQDYDRVATSFAHLDGYPPTVLPGADGPSAFRPPMYPAVLAPVYAVFGDHSYTAGRIENAFIGVVDVALIGVVALQLFSRRTAAMALVIAAVHPTLILYGSGLQLEPLLVAFELGAIAAALEHRRAPRGLRWPLVAGVLIGFSVLTREIGMWLIPAVGLLVWTVRPRWSRSALAAPVVVVVAAAVVVVPWTVRNARTFDAFVPVTTSSGVVLAGTYNATSMAGHASHGDHAVWISPWFDHDMGEVILAHQHQDEVAIDGALRHAALDFLRDHPGYLAKVAFWNTVRLFDLQGPGHAVFLSQFLPYPPRLTRIAVFSSYVVELLALAAFALPLFRRVPKALWIFPVLVLINLVIVSGNIRYRASIEPFSVLLAAITVTFLVERRHGYDRSHIERGGETT